MESLIDVLSRLRRVRALQFDARTRAATGWDGIGTGAVTVSEPIDGVVVFAEAGTWRPRAPGRGAIGFNNVFRWSPVGAALRLEHLRFGPDRPVFLFDMAPGEDGVWRVVSPHQCREDGYTASLAIECEQLVVAWSVVGPRKHESIRYTYW